jgi:hypothetical protein
MMKKKSLQKATYRALKEHPAQADVRLFVWANLQKI